MKFDGKAFGEELAAFTRAYIDRAQEPLRAQVAGLINELAEVRAKLHPDPMEEMRAMVADAIAKAVAEFPAPKDGVNGAAGIDGKSITVDDVAPLLEEIITRKVAEIPRPTDGKDGRDGIDGKDGIGLAGVLKDHEGCVVFTLTNGAIVKLGTFDGKDGDAGKDGAPGRDVDPELVRATIQEEVQKQVTAPLADAYKGVWRPGVYKRGDLVTWGGSLWFAKAETEAKPEKDEAWVLVVKRGRDGKDGEAPKPPPVVKL